MKILVTGSNGLLGQTLTALLRDNLAIQYMASSKGANRFVDKSGYEYAEMDVCDKLQMEKVISEFNPDVIIHTAALTNVDTCHSDRDLCWRLNVEAVGHLVEVCEEGDIHLIHLSTDFVFDGAKGPYSEDDGPNPISYYGKSKYEAEKLIQKSSCRWAIVRTILVYGKTSNMSRSNIVLWAKSALEKGETIKVVEDQWRMPTLVQDLAQACWLIADKNAEGIFHISGKDMMTVYDLVCQVADFWKLDKELIVPNSSHSLNQDAKRPAKTGFILDKAFQVIGYTPRSFLEGLELLDKQINVK